MSWFNLRKKKTTEPEVPKHLAVKPSAAPAPVVPRTAAGGAAANTDILRRPHISERASHVSANGVYVFKVAPRATKREIRAAVSVLYKVAVEKVRTVTVHPKRIIVKGKRGIRGGGKKAYVYLKAGQKIEVL